LPGQDARWTAVRDAVPILRWLPSYQTDNLSRDLLAGAIVAALLIPQSLGYARIAGVPVQVGLYAVPLALLAYAVLGSSPQLIVGPASTVAIVSGALVADISGGDPQQALAVTAALAIATGLVLVLVGLLRVAWVAEFLSKPIVTGFVFGLTLTIVIGELPTLLGIPKPPGDLIGVLIRTLGQLGQTDVLTAVVSGLALTMLVGGKHLAPRVPWGLVTLVLAVVTSRWIDLAASGVATVGDVPGGLPPLGLPVVPPTRLGAIAVGGVSLALVALAEGLAATRLFAARGGYRVQTERELIGMGAANIAAGFSGGLAVTGSLSKTAAAAQAGGRSQVAGLTSAGFVIVVLVAFTWFFADLPRAVLSAIVVAAVWELMDVAAMRRYAWIRTADLVAAVVGALGVVLFGPLSGLGIAIAVSLLAIIYRASFPHIEVLGKIKSEKAAWGRVRKHPDRQPVPGIVVVRLDAPLFWVNATAIENRLLDELDRWAGTRALILDLEATTRLDTTSVDVLEDLVDELNRRDITLYLARVLHPVNRVLQRSGFLALLGDDHSWHSISQCVRAARKDMGLAHKDTAEPDGSTDLRVGPSRRAESSDDGDTAHAERLAAMAEIEILEDGEDGTETSDADTSRPGRDVTG
jgi:high affinity sulfate transporter 1